jgi:hypothetical protein
MFRFAWLLLCLLLPQIALAKAGGVDSRKDMPPLGCGSAATGEQLECHFQDPDPQLMVTIDGPTQIDFAPEATGFYTASLPVNYLQLKGAGINAHIDRPNPTGCELEPFAPIGKLAFKNDSLDPSDPVLSHFYAGEPPPIPDLVNVWAYQFLIVNCKAPGSLLLRVAMNAFDGSGDEDGEHWNFATLPVDIGTVPEPGAALIGGAAIAGLGTLARRRHR